MQDCTGKEVANLPIERLAIGQDPLAQLPMGAGYRIGTALCRVRKDRGKAARQLDELVELFEDSVEVLSKLDAIAGEPLVTLPLLEARGQVQHSVEDILRLVRRIGF